MYRLNVAFYTIGVSVLILWCLPWVLESMSHECWRKAMPVLIHTTTWISPQNTTLSEKSQAEKKSYTRRFQLHKGLRSHPQRQNADGQLP